MRLNIYAAFGSITGWFIIAPIFPPYIQLTYIDLLKHSIFGLLITIIIGLLFGTIDEYFEMRFKHIKTKLKYMEKMIEYRKLKEEIERQKNEPFIRKKQK